MMSKVLYILLLFFCSTTLASCQNQQDRKDKNVMEQDLFEWEEGASAAAGYPMEIYAGGFTSMDGTYSPLSGGVIEGYWGQRGSGMFSGVKQVPKFLHVQWLSFVERCFYEAAIELDYEKMLRLFQEGYLTRMGKLGIQRRTYDNITVGFAPGGVVMIWLHGGARIVEIGRYQGNKITISQEEIDKLDSDQAYIFDSTGWQSVVDVNRENLNRNDDTNPEHKDLKKKLDSIPIPFGLWDTYRKKYNWNPVFEFQNGGGLDLESAFKVNYINGEYEHIFSDRFPLNGVELRAFPRRILFDWKDKDGKEYGGKTVLNEESVFAAFKKVFGNDSEGITAELEIRVNIPNTYFTIRLKGSNGKSAFIKTEGLIVIDF